MRATLLTVCLTGLIFGVASCGGGKAKEGIARTYYNRTIEYSVEPSAKEFLSKLEMLVGRAQKLDPPIPDEFIVPIYRDADMDRDHYITKMEAEAFYHDYILKFEDSLGSVKLHSSDN